MADNQTSADDAGAEIEFADPLGVKDPVGCDVNDDGDGVFSQVAAPVKPVDVESGRIGVAKLTLDDDTEKEVNDLAVVVDNPEKHVTAMESYITFRVVTKTTRCEFDCHEFEVRRRYNDFLWLRQRLEETQPTHFVPPLPEKHSLKRLDRFNQDFVKTRMGALQKFLSRVTEHPVLSFNKYFVIFLTAKQSELQAAKKEGSGLISRLADSFHNMSASYMMKNRADEFSSMNDYVNAFGEKLAVLERISQRIVKEQYDFLSELNEWGPVFTLWSNSEDRLQHALAAVAKSIEQCFLAMQALLDQTEMQFYQPLREYMLYIEAMKAVLRRRDAIQVEYEMTLEELNRKKDEKEQVSMSLHSYSLRTAFGKDPEQVKQEKMEKHRQQLDELSRQVEVQRDKMVCHVSVEPTGGGATSKMLSRQVEVLQDKMVCCDSDLISDMERWHKQKRSDFRQLFVQMADRQITYYQKCLEAWENSIPAILKTEKFANINSMRDTANNELE
ncbi:Sorting nexin-30 [Lamellibrachia satsuma]|nr:Sorting nexin-30 [Lamellibrachia satsuma]